MREAELAAVRRLERVTRVPWCTVASRFQFALPDPRPRDGWFRIGNIDITSTALLVMIGVASMFLFAISTTLFGQLVFDPVLVRNGEIWRLLTWPLANAPGIWAVLTMVFFWFVGHIIEELLGRRRYAILLAVVTVIPAAVVSLLDPVTFPSIDVGGLRLLLTGTVVVFAAEYPHAP